MLLKCISDAALPCVFSSFCQSDAQQDAEEEKRVLRKRERDAVAVGSISHDGDDENTRRGVEGGVGDRRRGAMGGGEVA